MWPQDTSRPEAQGKMLLRIELHAYNVAARCSPSKPDPATLEDVLHPTEPSDRQSGGISGLRRVVPVISALDVAQPGARTTLPVRPGGDIWH
jgi:hypothetical protein